jgi:hypothetical protein
LVRKVLIMKKTILFLLLITFSLILTSCINYSNYKDVKIPDDNIGTVKIPNHWEFKVIDDWIHIIDTEKDEIIGIQWDKGLYYYVDTILYDERLFNPYFDDYERVKSDLKSGNSNGAQWGHNTWEMSSISYDYKFFLFNGSEDSSYNIRIIMIDNSIKDSVLSDIAKSYKR